MYKNVRLHYLNAATSEDICLGMIDQSFENVEKVMEYIEEYAKDFFWGRPYEDTDSEIYAENDTTGFKSQRAKKFFCPSCDEPFDCDKESDVDFNGGWY